MMMWMLWPRAQGKGIVLLRDFRGGQGTALYHEADATQLEINSE